MTTNERLAAPKAPKAPRKRIVSRRVRHACDLLISGEVKTIQAAATRAGLSREHLSRTLRTPHGQSFWTQRARETVHAGAPIAANRLIELLHSPSEHVAMKTAALILATEGIKPAERPIQNNVNLMFPGHVINWRSDTESGPLVGPGGMTAREQVERIGYDPDVLIYSEHSPSDAVSPATAPLTIEHQEEGHDDADDR